MALIGYARVSTRTQNDEPQHDMLEAAGCERVFTDKISGRLAKRPDWDACREYLRAGDTLVVTRLSRIARSVRNLTEVAHWLEERGIHLKVITTDIDTRSPAGRLLFHVLGAVDEFQADIISENTREGLAAARARGRRGGRRKSLTGPKREEALRMYDSRERTVEQIAQIVGASRATIYRELTKREASGGE